MARLDKFAPPLLALKGGTKVLRKGTTMPDINVRADLIVKVKARVKAGETVDQVVNRLLEKALQSKSKKKGGD